MKRSNGKCSYLICEWDQLNARDVYRFCLNSVSDGDTLCRRHKHQRCTLERARANPNIRYYHSEPLEGWCDEESRHAGGLLCDIQS